MPYYEKAANEKDREFLETQKDFKKELMEKIKKNEKTLKGWVSSAKQNIEKEENSAKESKVCKQFHRSKEC